jgi:hypothetical protein
MDWRAWSSSPCREPTIPLSCAHPWRHGILRVCGGGLDPHGRGIEGTPPHGEPVDAGVGGAHSTSATSSAAPDPNSRRCPLPLFKPAMSSPIGHHAQWRWGGVALAMETVGCWLACVIWKPASSDGEGSSSVKWGAESAHMVEFG